MKAKELSAKELAARIREGLRRCLPETEEDAALTCDTCPYMRRCMTDGGKLVGLPESMIRDVRALAAAMERTAGS